ncbi:MAG: CvpA family protein [Holosporaceae bacterium]|jgi:membrane protein required for colicin V production|nr:CvpA family protein [Holosporaceae bacterium]
MNNEFFNALDYTYILLAFVSTMMGFIRGFTRDFFSSCAWFGSGFLSNLLAPRLIPVIRKYVANRAVAGGLAWVIVYLAILVCSLLIVGALSRNVKQSIFSGMDRAAGVLFGLFRGIAIAVCFCLALIALKIPKDEYPLVKESKLSSILFAVMGPSAPGTVNDAIKSIKGKKIQRRKAKSMAAKVKKIVEKVPPKPEEKVASKEDKASLDKIKDWIAGALAKHHTAISTDGENRYAEEQRAEPETSEGNAPFGVMSIMEARTRRRAEKRAALLKKEIRRRLDNDGR